MGTREAARYAGLPREREAAPSGPGRFCSEVGSGPVPASPTRDQARSGVAAGLGSLSQSVDLTSVLRTAAPPPARVPVGTDVERVGGNRRSSAGPRRQQGHSARAETAYHR